MKGTEIKNIYFRSFFSYGVFIAIQPKNKQVLRIKIIFAALPSSRRGLPTTLSFQRLVVKRVYSKRLIVLNTK